MAELGTAENPYVCKTWTDIVNYGKNSSHCVLANDIDMKSTQRVSGITLNCVLDMQGHTIKNILYTGNEFIYSESGCTIKNGKLLNIFADNTNYLFRAKMNPNGTHATIYLTDVAISVNADTIKGTQWNMFTYVNINKCNVYIAKKDGSPRAAFFSSCVFKDSRICFEVDNLSGAFPIASGTALNGVSIEGYVRGKLEVNVSAISLESSVWDVDTSDLLIEKVMFEISGTGIYNAEKNPNVISRGLSARTTEEILSPDFNNNHGFPVKKED